jgi:hypothetical protein
VPGENHLADGQARRGRETRGAGEFERMLIGGVIMAESLQGVVRWQ